MTKDDFEFKCSLDQIKAELAAGQKAHREAFARLREELRQEFEKGRQERDEAFMALQKELCQELKKSRQEHGETMGEALDEALTQVAATTREVFGRRNRD